MTAWGGGDDQDWSHLHPAYSGVEPPPLPPVPSPYDQSSTPRVPRRTVGYHLLAAVLVVLVVVVGAGLVAHTWTPAADPDRSADHPRAAPPPSYPPPPSYRPPPLPTCTAPAPGPVTPAGWQQVGSSFGVGYDVPADWTVASCDWIYSWVEGCESPLGFCPVETINAVADRRDANCPDSIRTVTGLDSRTATSDLRAAAREAAIRVRKMYSRVHHIPTVALSDPLDVTVAGWPGVKIVATITNIRQVDECESGSAVHTVLAFSVPGRSDALVFVASVDQGYADASDPAVTDRIIATLRPV